MVKGNTKRTGRPKSTLEAVVHGDLCLFNITEHAALNRAQC